MFKKLKHLNILFTFLLTNIIYSQSQIISIWNDTIPGTISATDYKEIEISNDGIVQKIKQITTPTLLVFKPKQTKPNGAAVLICPGGGYAHLSIYKEGKKVAEWLNSLGITAFVLKYRLPSDIIMTDKTIGPLQDAQKALRLIRQNSNEWNINPNNIGVMGFSAGGHLAATLSTHYNQATYNATDAVTARPDFSILIYPVISMKNEITHKGSQANLLGNNPSHQLINEYSNELQTNCYTPPTFIVHTSDDLSVPVENSIRYFLALKNNNAPVELHIYEKGGHGFGLGVDDTSQFWTSECEKWLRTQKILNTY